MSGERFGRFEVLLAERRLHVDGRHVALGSRAFELLAALVERRDRVVPKDELIEVVWPGLVVEENNLQVQISALRKVLGAQSIATVPGRGYRFAVAPGASDAVAAAGAVAQRPAECQATTAPTPDRRRSKVLVADDNKVNRLLLCRTLQLMGHDVETVENGRLALELLRRSPFDLLLLDLEMPELDGFGLLEARLGEPALLEVPVIVTSSLEGVAHVARCIELGADDYLHKPLSAVLLKARVGASLERKHLRDRERERVARLVREPAGLAGEHGSASGARRVEATLLAARLRGVDEAGSLPADEAFELLNGWTTLMTDAIESRGGVVGQMTGDGLTAAFGAAGAAPVTGREPPLAGVRAALEMVELTRMFDAERATAVGAPPLELQIGIATGEVVAGWAGTPRRSGYVCIGAPVQRAAELGATGAAVGRAVLMDAASRAAVSGEITSEPVGSAWAPLVG